MPRRKKNGPVMTRVESTGVRERMDRPVRDSEEALMLLITRKDIERARHNRKEYVPTDPDDPYVFAHCALAVAAQERLSGARIQILASVAHIALPGEDFTRRYTLDETSQEFIHLNDEQRFDELPENITVVLQPPRRSQRLSYKRTRMQKARHDNPGHRSDFKNRKPLVTGKWRDGKQLCSEDEA